jgi:hypothetical protein
LCEGFVKGKDALWCSMRRAGDTDEFEVAAGICGGANNGNSCNKGVSNWKGN